MQVGNVHLNFMESGGEPGGNGRRHRISSEWSAVENLLAGDAHRSGPSGEIVALHGNLCAHWTTERGELLNDRRMKRRADIWHPSALDAFAQGRSLSNSIDNQHFVHDGEPKWMRERAPDPAKFLLVERIQHNFYLFSGIAEARHKHVLWHDGMFMKHPHRFTEDFMGCGIASQRVVLRIGGHEIMEI